MEEREINKLLRDLRGKPTKSSGSCPNESHLAAYVGGGFDDRSKKTTEAHLVTCDDCLSQVAFLMRSAEWPEAAEVPATLYHRARRLVLPKRTAWFGWDWRWATAAAAAACFVVLFAMVALQLRRQNSVPRPDDTVVALQASPAPIVPEPASLPSSATPVAGNPVATPKARGAQAPLVRSGTLAEPLPTLISPRAGAVLRRDNLEFRWQPVPDAVFYAVQVMTASGDLVFEGQTEATKLKPAVTVILQPGTKYFVVTQAHLRQGKASKSSVVSFRLAE
jgi:hypothetical protein